jgi:tetratricopeptide (TPR) repeat protein
VTEQGLALAPESFELLQQKAMIALAQGDLRGARAVLRGAPKEVESAELVAFMGNYWDLSWVLDEEQHRLLVGLTPGRFDDDRASWGIVLAQSYGYHGDRARARAYADSALGVFEGQLRDTPDDAQLRMIYGLALAYAGRKADAIREGQRGVALQPVSQDAFSGVYIQHLLARIYLLTGEDDKAIDQLESLLGMPYYLSPGWLRIDPTFDPLRKHPRFQKLLGNGTA